MGEEGEYIAQTAAAHILRVSVGMVHIHTRTHTHAYAVKKRLRCTQWVQQFLGKSFWWWSVRIYTHYAKGKESKIIKCNAIEWGDKAQNWKKRKKPYTRVVVYAIFVYLKSTCCIYPFFCWNFALHRKEERERKWVTTKTNGILNCSPSEAFLMTVRDSSWKLSQSPFG